MLKSISFQERVSRHPSRTTVIVYEIESESLIEGYELVIVQRVSPVTVALDFKPDRKTVLIRVLRRFQHHLLGFAFTTVIRI